MIIIYEQRSRKTGLNDKIFDFHFFTFSENIIFMNDETKNRFKIRKNNKDFYSLKNYVCFH